jgi:hypothetical protein
LSAAISTTAGVGVGVLSNNAGVVLLRTTLLMA